MRKNLYRFISVVILSCMILSCVAVSACPFNNGIKEEKLDFVIEDTSMQDTGQKIPARQADGCIFDGSNYPVPAKGHPRLYVNKELLPVIRGRIGRSEYSTAWSKIIENSSIDCDGKLTGESPNYNSNYLRIIESNALRYLLFGNKINGEKAVRILNNYLSTYVPPSSTGSNYNEIGSVLVAGAMVYDWCYDLIPQAEKLNLISTFKTLAAKTSLSYPPVNMGIITGHGSESQLAKDQLSVGVAVYDEDPEIYNYAAKRLFDEYIPAREFSYPSKFFHQGLAYAGYRTQFDMYPLWIYDRMGYSDVLPPELREMCYSFMYYRRPDGNVLRDGDYGSQFFYEYATGPKILMLASSYYKDPYLRHEFKRGINTLAWEGYPWDANYVSAVEYMLFYDDSVESEPDNKLPLTMYYPSPVGAMVARTGWDNGINSNTVVAMMKLGEYNFTNHNHNDAGNFELYYKGPLIYDSGLYKGTYGSYGSDHDFNYHKRTIAHNTMLVYDPNEVFTWNTRSVVNDGGQRLPNDGIEPRDMESLLNNGYKTGEILSNWYGPYKDVPDYSYLKGDLTMAYSSKVEKFLRSFVFLNLGNDEHPAAMIVYDKVTASDPGFKKSFLLHSIEEPEISGKTTTIKRTTDGYTGKVVNTTLMPTEKDLEITKVGGENKYDVYGTQFLNEPRYKKGVVEDIDSWQVNINPVVPKKTDYFLNVLQVMDNEGNVQPLAAEKLIFPKTLGVKISDRVVLFSSNGEPIQDEFTFNIAGDGIFKYLMCDLEEGCWTVYKNDRLLYQAKVEGDEGSLYFEGEPGVYTVKKEMKRCLSYPNIAPKGENTSKESPEAIIVNQKPCSKNSHIKIPYYNDQYIPLRTVLDTIGFITTYDGTTNTITSKDKFSALIYEVDKGIAKIDGFEAKVSKKPIIEDDVTYVHTSFFNEVFGGSAVWNNYARVMNITIPRPETTEVNFSAVYPNQIPVKTVTSTSDDGNKAINTIDGSLETRWSASGNGQWVMYDFGEVKTISSVAAAWYRGDQRSTKYQLFLSEDGENWTQIFDGVSSGTSVQFEYHDAKGQKARYLKLVGFGNNASGSSSLWTSPSEVIAFQ